MTGTGRQGPPEGDAGTPAERHTLRIDDDVDERLDAFLADRLDLSRSRVASLIGEGAVRVGGSSVRKSYRPRRGDRIEVLVPPREGHTVQPENLPISIRWEDAHLLVVEKPAGQVVHPAPGHWSGTLVNALLHHVDRLSPVGAPHRPGIVHRLDRDTSGLLVVAKDETTHRRLAAALARRRVTRGYLAAAWGHLDADRGTIDRPLGRDPRHRKRMAVVDDGRRAVTHWRRLERWMAADLLAVKLETGRTHQIRVHLRDTGHPLVGDPLYGPDWERGFTGAGARWAAELRRRAGRLFLHAARLAFRHPVTGERLAFTSELPAPLDAAVAWARDAS